MATATCAIPRLNSSAHGILSFGRPALSLEDRTGIELFAQALKQIGYPGSRRPEFLGRELSAMHRRRELPLFLRRLEGPPPLASFVKLFAFKVPVEEAEARAALAPLDLDRAAEIGLLRVQNGKARATVGISTCENLFIAHDRTSTGDQESMASQWVLGINPPTLLLARLTPREAVRRSLEIGTGCGVLALLAAAHSEQVIATDLNPHALNFAQFNAALNGITNVEFRLGSLFEPVKGERFDLIFCNPPYVISPHPALLFRDSGNIADGFCEQLIRSLPEYLNEGAFASALCNWAHYTEEDWSVPVKRWVADSNCDSWLLHGHDYEPLTYASDWNRHVDTETFESVLDQWMEHYGQLGIKRISSGGIILRRRSSGPNWVRTDQLPDPLKPLHSLVQRVFAAEDYLARSSDEQLLNQAFSISSNHRITQVLGRQNGDYVIEQMRLESADEFWFDATMDPPTLHLLRGFDGRRPLKALLEELAARIGAEPHPCVQRGLTIVKGLLANGVIMPGQIDEENNIKRKLNYGS